VLVGEWTKASLAPSHALLCQHVGRTVSKVLNRLNPTPGVIPCDRRVRRQALQLRRRPYIYTEDEVRRLLEIARNFPSPRSPLRPLTLYTMVVLAYCAGLRLGEIVRLNLGDIDFREGTIDVRDTKFFKARRLPLASSVISALRSYLAAREQAGGPAEPASGLFWHTQSPGRYSRVQTHMLLVRVLRRAGLKPEKGYAGPRVHDLRHAFVSNRMLAWYRQGINPQPRLPYLATYLGHKDITSTLVYLTVTQELLQQASERFRVLGARILRASTGGMA
jgi:integrase/recombinase XerD